MPGLETLKKSFRTIRVTGTGLTGDALLADASGNTVFDISDVNWQRIVMGASVSTLAGTNVIVKLISSNAAENLVVTKTTAAKKADGSTDMSYTAITQAGEYITATGKIASTGAAASDIGRYVSILVDAAGTLTAGTLTVDLYLEGA